jgi:hypothetical protein
LWGVGRGLRISLGISVLLKKRMMMNPEESSSEHFPKVCVPLHDGLEPELPRNSIFGCFFFFSVVHKFRVDLFRVSGSCFLVWEFLKESKFRA